MAYDQALLKGTTSYLMEFGVRSSTTGQLLTALAAGSVTCTYQREGAAGQTTVTLDGTMVLGTWKTGGWKETGTTGFYQFGVPDAALATGANAVTFTFKATGMIDKTVRILLEDMNRRDGVRMGLTGIANAAAGAAGGLALVGSNMGSASSVTADVGITQAGADKVWSSAARTLTSFGTLVASIWAAVVDSGGVTTLLSRIGSALTIVGGKAAATVATGDDADAATLISRLTAARAGYLDNLNVGGAVASHADVLAINQSSSKHILLVTVGQYEPGETYTVEMRTFAAADGLAVNADTTPTLTAAGQVSGSLAANLSAATNPATGVYRWTYTPGSTPTLEQIRFDGSATISGSTFTLSAYSQTVDFATAVFTATDQGHLTSIFNKLPANSIADETLLVSAIGSPMQAGPVTVGTNNDKTGYSLTAPYDPAKTAAQAGDAMSLTGGERTAIAAGTWNQLTSAIVAAGSVGKRLLDFVANLVYVAPSNPNDYARNNVSPSWYAAANNVGIATALDDLASLLARTDPITAIGLIKSVTDKLSTMITDTPGVYTGASLVNAPSGGGGGGAGRPYMIYFDNALPIKAALNFRKGDIGVIIQETIRFPKSNTPFDLTGCTLRFQLINLSGGTIVLDHPASIAYADGGVAYYSIQEGDFDTLGTFFRRWRITDGDGRITTYPEIPSLTITIT